MTPTRFVQEAGFVIEVRHLRYFIAVAEELHFGRAAERLHMAQSPLSHQIRQLERRLGVVLLERDHHVIGLTDAGRIFLEEARSLLEQLDLTIERTRRAGRGEVGSIRIGYVPEVTAELLALSLRAHHASFPDIEVDLRQGTTGGLLDDVRQRSVDVAFVRSPGRLDELEFQQLMEEPFVAVLPAGHHLRGRRFDVSDLADDAFVVPSYGGALGLRRDIESACAAAGFTPAIAREAGSLSAIPLLVAAGNGVALIPAGVAKSYPVPGTELAILLDPPTTRAGVVWRRAEPSQVIQNFLDTTRDVVSGSRRGPLEWSARAC